MKGRFRLEAVSRCDLALAEEMIGGDVLAASYWGSGFEDIRVISATRSITGLLFAEPSCGGGNGKREGGLDDIGY